MISESNTLKALSKKLYLPEKSYTKAFYFQKLLLNRIKLIAYNLRVVASVMN